MSTETLPEMHTVSDGKGQPADTESNGGVVVVPVDELRAHMRRVEFLSATLRAVLTGVATHPMFAGMLPPDVRQMIEEL